MQRLTEPECEIIELLQKAQPESVPKGIIIASLEIRDTCIVDRSLDKLVRRNYISEKERDTFTYYLISENNKQVRARRVMCPKCKKVRRIFSDTQLIADCKNPECKTPAGKRTKFWLIARSVKLKGGEIKYLNTA